MIIKVTCPFDRNSFLINTDFIIQMYMSDMDTLLVTRIEFSNNTSVLSKESVEEIYAMITDGER